MLQDCIFHLALKLKWLQLKKNYLLNRKVLILTYQRHLNIERLQNSIIQLTGVSDETYQILDELLAIIKQIKKNQRFHKAIETNEIIPLKETGIYDLFKVYIKNSKFIEEIDPESYVFEVYGIVKAFD